MRIEIIARDHTGRTAIRATPEQYDGVPIVDTVYFDRELGTTNRDLIGVACALLFAPYLEGGLNLPFKVSVEAAAAIEHYLLPAKVRVDSIDYEPFAAQVGEGTVSVTLEPLQNPVPNVWGFPRTSCVSLLDSSIYSGTLASMDGVAVATNAVVLSQLYEGRHRPGILVGAALLHCEPLQANWLVVDESWLSSEERIGLAALLTGCKMRFGTIGEAITRQQHAAMIPPSDR